jgi:hypothetical protein
MQAAPGQDVDSRSTFIYIYFFNLLQVIDATMICRIVDVAEGTALSITPPPVPDGA